MSDVPEVKYMKEGDVWILKPSMTNQARAPLARRGGRASANVPDRTTCFSTAQTRGIVIFDSLDALRVIIRAPFRRLCCAPPRCLQTPRLSLLYS